MAPITWLHLSDLHSCNPRTGWDAARVEEALVRDLAELREKHGLEPNLLFFTGDAAFGKIGSEPEETVAGQLVVFGELLEKIRQAIDEDFPWENVFLVPGNHDVDREEADPTQLSWFDDTAKLRDVKEMIRQGKRSWRNVMARLADYRGFLESHPGLRHLLQDPERLIYATHRQVGEHRVGVAGLNSAWSCCRSGEKERPKRSLASSCIPS
jgi:hypothetical protein